MFRFENPYYLYALLLIPVMFILYLLMLNWKKRKLNEFGDLPVIMKLLPDISSFKTKSKIFLQLLAFSSLIIGIANPQLGSKLQEVKREGVDVILALDVSNSMLAEDLSPNRLERAKRGIAQFVDQLKGDRLGLIVFAGEAYVQLPITTDYAAAKMFLTTINTDIVPTQGTAIGSAIDLSVKSFGERNDERKSRVIIILSDGEDHQDDPIQAAKSASEEGIIIHTIGLGSPQGSPIPVYKNNKPAGYKTDKEGNTVVTRLDEETLQQIASVGKGLYVRASNAEMGLKLITTEINKMEKQEIEMQMYSDFEDQFQYFIAFALLLLTLDFFTGERKNRWFKGVNIFE
jgi:Ca-activated chloride channel homolog